MSKTFEEWWENFNHDYDPCGGFIESDIKEAWNAAQKAMLDEAENICRSIVHETGYDWNDHYKPIDLVNKLRKKYGVSDE